MHLLTLAVFLIIGKTDNLLEKFQQFEPLHLEEAYEGYPHNDNYKNNRLDLIAKFIPSVPIILEAGSNQGEDTVLMASKWPHGQIFAFEAFPEVFYKLKKNVLHFKNIHPFQYALAKNDGYVTFYLSETCYPASSILDRTQYVEKQFGGRNIQVQSCNLDSFCTTHGISKIDFMWLDLEGAEKLVLSAAPKILSSVKCIYTETNFQVFRHGTVQYNELKKFLEDEGFELIAHWYRKDWQGDAIFVRKDLLKNDN